MNRELEALILAFEAVSASRDKEAERCMEAFESLLDAMLDKHPGVSRGILRKSIIKQHRKWALQQDNKPPAIPPKARESGDPSSEQLHVVARASFPA